jgi:SAM-dependent methyltransferase
MSCPLCQHSEHQRLLARQGVPVLQNAPAATQALARNVPRGDLEIVLCLGCGFIYNAAFDNDRIAYGSHYDNAQHHSALFGAYLEELAILLVERHQLQHGKVIEVGCGSGYFLKLLCAKGAKEGMGFDISYEGPEQEGPVQFRRMLYQAGSTSGADLVVCRHVLEHVSEPMGLLQGVRAASKSPFFIEVPTIDWILKQRAFWDFFYEHCNYFSLSTLRYALAKAGWQVTAADTVFGGQYLWVEAENALPVDAPPLLEEIQKIQTEALAMQKQLHAWQNRLEQLSAQGGVAVWGAAAKGVTLVNLLDPQAQWAQALIDINPRKQGCFCPGTGHPILAPEALNSLPVRHLIITNPNYLPEIQAQIQGLSHLTLHPLVEIL